MNNLRKSQLESCDKKKGFDKTLGNHFNSYRDFMKV